MNLMHVASYGSSGQLYSIIICRVGGLFDDLRDFMESLGAIETIMIIGLEVIILSKIQ